MSRIARRVDPLPFGHETYGEGEALCLNGTCMACPCLCGIRDNVLVL